MQMKLLAIAIRRMEASPMSYTLARSPKNRAQMEDQSKCRRRLGSCQRDRKQVRLPFLRRPL